MRQKISVINKSQVTLYATGFIQVYFVAVNTYCVTKSLYIGVVIASFMISLIWSFNVKKIAFGTMSDRVLYAIGATCGSIAGLWSSAVITAFILSL